MVFGTFVGAAADRTGRKKAALTYVAAYSLGCFTKHSSSFSVLLVGRLLCGVATSLLYSAFESWLVAEHFRRGYDADLLGGTFAKAVFIGNGLVAIVGAGIIFYSETKRESFRERGRERERKRERAAGRFWREKNSPLLNDPEKKKNINKTKTQPASSPTSSSRPSPWDPQPPSTPRPPCWPWEGSSSRRRGPRTSASRRTRPPLPPSLEALPLLPPPRALPPLPRPRGPLPGSSSTPRRRSPRTRRSPSWGRCRPCSRVRVFSFPFGEVSLGAFL